MEPIFYLFDSDDHQCFSFCMIIILDCFFHLIKLYCHVRVKNSLLLLLFYYIKFYIKKDLHNSVVYYILRLVAGLDWTALKRRRPALPARAALLHLFHFFGLHHFQRPTFQTKASSQSWKL